MQGSISGNIRRAFFSEIIRKAFFLENTFFFLILELENSIFGNIRNLFQFVWHWSGEARSRYIKYTTYCLLFKKRQNTCLLEQCSQCQLPVQITFLYHPPLSLFFSFLFHLFSPNILLLLLKHSPVTFMMFITLVYFEHVSNKNTKYKTSCLVTLSLDPASTIFLLVKNNENNKKVRKLFYLYFFFWICLTTVKPVLKGHSWDQERWLVKMDFRFLLA